MTELIDDLDRAILDILQKDGRTPASQIAEQVGLSRPAVAERMEKLERSGVILGTTTVVSPTATGLGVTAFVSARRPGHLDGKAAKAFDSFGRKKEVLEIHTVAGDDCYLIKLRTDSMQSLNALVGALTKEPLSMTTRTTIVMETHCEKMGGVNLVGGDR